MKSGGEDMATVNPAIVPRLVQLSEALARAKHGEGKVLKEQACVELNVSNATLHRYLHQVSVRAQRKQRSDSGNVVLPREEALLISAYLMNSLRKTKKRLLSIEQAVLELRTEGEVKADYVTTDGEVKQLSTSAIASALKTYSLHPDQLLRPAPAVELKSLHPNHVWSIDASMCVLYYLKTSAKQKGLQVMPHDKFYKNKPKNLESIAADRVWSYEVTDHYSGAIFVHYVMGAESAANLIESFIECISQRGKQPFYGVPYILMMDKGSANTSGLFVNFARRMGIKLLPHAAGNARATGQVEKARDQIERSFESQLSLAPIANLEELNLRAREWAGWYNAHRIHSRHKQTRFAMWMQIRAEQLRIAPSRDVCLSLLTSHPEERKVKDKLRINFAGREFDVSCVQGVMIGEKLHVCTNPYSADSVQILLKDAEGNELIHQAPLVAKDDAGFAENANVIGEDYSRHADTVLDGNRKEVERTIYEATTDEQAEAARKARVTPFGGRIDPRKVIEQAPVPTYIPKRGTDLDVKTTTVVTPKPQRVLNPFEVLRELTNRGITMTAPISAMVRRDYPQGATEEEVDGIVAKLNRPMLRVVNGGAV